MSNQDTEAPVQTDIPVVVEKLKKPKPRKAKPKVKAAAKPKRAAKRKAKAKVAAKPNRKAKSVKVKSTRGKSKAKTGRARKTRRKNSAAIKNKLYKLLKVKMPKTFRVDGEFNFRKLISAVKMTPEGVYRWFRNDHLTPVNALALIKASKGRVKIADLIPFVFK
jgi:hypothetical protein